MHAVSTQALKLARANNVRTVLDIDYRPVLWGLSGKADGETRFVSNEGVTSHLQAILPQFDLIVGTEEEFMIAGGGADIMASPCAPCGPPPWPPWSSSGARWAAPSSTMWCRPVSTTRITTVACAWKCSTCWAQATLFFPAS